MFTIWKTIRVGTGLKTAEDYAKAIDLAGAGLEIYNYEFMFSRPDFFRASQVEKEIDLVNVSLEELGLNSEAGYEIACARAKERGLEICPDDAAFELRIQYIEQPITESVYFMYSTPDYLFQVIHDGSGEKLLRRVFCKPAEKIHPKCRLVFALPRKCA